MFGGDGGFSSSSAFVGEPREKKFFIHGGSEGGIEGFPEFVGFVEAVAPGGDAMFFNAVAFSDLPIGKAFGGGENDLDSRESVFAKGMGAKGLL